MISHPEANPESIAAILDLCKLQGFPKVAILATKLKKTSIDPYDYFHIKKTIGPTLLTATRFTMEQMGVATGLYVGHARCFAASFYPGCRGVGVSNCMRVLKKSLNCCRQTCVKNLATYRATPRDLSKSRDILINYFLIRLRFLAQNVVCIVTSFCH